jgi:SAM-dependent methyltransferase
VSGRALYDSIGTGYTRHRGEDPRIAAQIHAALGDARSVVNVGAGAGAYEPRDREVTAVEPSEVMIAQRAPGAAPAIQASAEALPFPDGSFDAAMAILSDHHWPERERGLAELRRVARKRVVVLQHGDDGMGWLDRDYLVTFRPDGPSLDELGRHFGMTRMERVPIPHDCRDGFLHAYWRRPHAYLDPDVRASISVFRLLSPEDVADAVTRLRADLESGEWQRRNADVLELDELDLGYRLMIAEL